MPTKHYECRLCGAAVITEPHLIEAIVPWMSQQPVRCSNTSCPNSSGPRYAPAWREVQEE